MQYNLFKLLYIIFFCLSSIFFFRPSFIPLSLLSYILYVNIFITLVIVLFKTRNLNIDFFRLSFILILLSILISAISATYSWGQGLFNSFKAITFYLSYLLFFLLSTWKIRVKDIEKIVIILGFVYFVIYAITFVFYPLPLFGDINSYDDSRGFQRIVLSGLGFLFLFSFYSLNKYLNKQQFIWVIFFVISVICIIMLLTRTLLVVSFIIFTLFILRKSNFLKKILAVMIIGCFVYIITQMNFFQLLMKESIEQSKYKEDNIRILSATFYINEFSPNTFSRIFGNGENYMDTSYASYMQYLQHTLGYYQDDIGYIGFYSKFGVIAILAYLFLIFKTYRVAIPEEYLYCKYYLYFIFLISLIIDAPFNVGYITSIVFAAYILNSKDLSKDNINSMHQKIIFAYK